MEPESVITDEELAKLAMEERGGFDVVRFEAWFYKHVDSVPGLLGKVIMAMDTGGYAALVGLMDSEMDDSAFEMDDRAF